MAARLYESKTIDMTTGEVKSITTVTVRKQTERFSMCRTTDGLKWLKQFTNKELQMLMVLNELENLQNRTVSLTPMIRKEIQEFFEISKSTFSGIITQMEDKGFLIRLSASDLLLNPSFFYKGESKNVLSRIKEFNKTYDEIRRKLQKSLIVNQKPVETPNSDTEEGKQSTSEVINTKE